MGVKDVLRGMFTRVVGTGKFSLGCFRSGGCKGLSFIVRGKVGMSLLRVGSKGSCRGRSTLGGMSTMRG